MIANKRLLQPGPRELLVDHVQNNQTLRNFRKNYPVTARQRRAGGMASSPPHWRSSARGQVHDFENEWNKKQRLSVGRALREQERAQLGLSPGLARHAHVALTPVEHTVHSAIPADRTGSRVRSQLWESSRYYSCKKHCRHVSLFHRITKGGGWPGPWGSPGPAPAPAASPGAGCPGQAAAEGLRERRFHTQESPDHVTQLILTRRR